MIVSVQTWPATTTATHIGDRQNSLSVRRIPPKFSWLLGPSVGQSTSQVTRTSRTAIMFRLLQ
ncbi:hypothetical protein T11_9439 [Trichinella zimbabwensis]|uniref:Uncharacterized protein n=1 Tax=Trichinella zimbabwensis TaxID=268475 RepID=A0A0V1GDA2_9BILA|nr:hypothetical protein T11_9439 [Trichinella zimbabwensis]